MKLYGSTTSPFVRMVRIAALELDADVELAPTVVKPTLPNADYAREVNPLRRVPALEAADGEIIIDSRVIVEYLNAAKGGALLPAEPAARIKCLNAHAVCAGAIESRVLAMYERRVRPAEFQWPDLVEDQLDKARTAVAWAESRADLFAADMDLAAIALVSFIDYAVFRFPDVDWLGDAPRLAARLEALAARPSVRETFPAE